MAKVAEAQDEMPDIEVEIILTDEDGTFSVLNYLPSDHSNDANCTCAACTYGQD